MFWSLETMLERFFEAKSFRFHIPKQIQVPKLTYLGYFCISCMYTHHVRMVCMYSMHLFYACILYMYSEETLLILWRSTSFWSKHCLFFGDRHHFGQNIAYSLEIDINFGQNIAYTFEIDTILVKTVLLLSRSTSFWSKHCLFAAKGCWQPSWLPKWGGPGGAYQKESHSLLTLVGSADYQ